MRQRLAIVGGGPAALFLLRQFISQPYSGIDIDIFEQSSTFGNGFPYSRKGAGEEHVTNVSGNEIPNLIDSLTGWLEANRPPDLDDAPTKKSDVSGYEVVPRLLFGHYLSDQFEKYISKAAQQGLPLTTFLDTRVTDIEQGDGPDMFVLTESGRHGPFRFVVICTGHSFHLSRGKKSPRYFASPYPPEKLDVLKNVPVILKGSSLTAVDAIRTLARVNGFFRRDEAGSLQYCADPDCPQFSITMHSKDGLLPGLRFHLQDPQLSLSALLSREEIVVHREKNGGYVSLDFLFGRNFKQQFLSCDPEFFHWIKDWSVEDFAGAAMASFSGKDPFDVFSGEYRDSLYSIHHKQPAFWKEKLALLSVSMNFPAKYLSAEDYTRFHEQLMPLISVVIAFVPQHSAEEILALHRAGKISLIQIEDGENAADQIRSGGYVNCTGQPQLSIADFPFPGLIKSGAVSQARISYRNKKKWFELPGLTITDNFRSVTKDGQPHPGLFLMAVPFIGGFNPDYSGLDFCEDAAKAIVTDIGEIIGVLQGT